MTQSGRRKDPIRKREKKGKEKFIGKRKRRTFQQNKDERPR